jgi:hypothetical protein
MRSNKLTTKGRQPLTDNNRLSHLRPDLALQWHHSKNHRITPADVSFGSHRKVWWKCPIHGTDFEQMVFDRVDGKTRCPACVWQKHSEARSKPKLGESLAERLPCIALEWHPSKNAPRTPQNVKHGSAFLAWWICPKCHNEYEVRVYVRKYSGCPKCGQAKRTLSLKTPKSGKSLADLFPELAVQWHPSKNGNLHPSQLKCGSNTKVWWKCRRGHEWQASPNNRTKGRNCPFCTTKTSRLQLRLYTELMSFFPDSRLRHKIDGIECDVFIPSLSVAVEVDGLYWHKQQLDKDKLKNERLHHKGIAVIRVHESGLPKIGPFDVVQSRNDTDLKICQEVVRAFFKAGFAPEKQFAHLQSYAEASKLRNETLFLALNNTLPNPLPGTSLAELNPNLASEWHPTRNGVLTPADVTLSSKWKYWWKCPEGKQHEWESTIDNRVSGTGCPFCSGKRVSETNCLQYVNPVLAAEWCVKKNLPLTPTQITAASSRRVWWQCPKVKEHVYEMSVSARAQKHGCPFCAGKRVHKTNCLAANYPSLKRWWHKLKNGQLTSFDVTAGSNKRVWWICPKGHEFQRTIVGRLKVTSCPICSNKEIHPSNCLAKVHPEIASEWNSTKNGALTPWAVVPGSNRKVWWKCKVCGQEWQAVPNMRCHQGTGCPACATRRRWRIRKKRFGPSGGAGPAANRRKVRRLDLNLVYPSIIEAAKRSGVSEVGLRKALKANKPIKGLHFVYAK